MITPIACALPDATSDGPSLNGAIEVTIAPDSRLGRIVAWEVIAEAYTCGFELNPEFQTALTATGLRIAGMDAAGSVRAVELPDHLFFIATLYQPQRASAEGRPHPLIAAYLHASPAHRDGRG